MSTDVHRAIDPAVQPLFAPDDEEGEYAGEEEAEQSNGHSSLNFDSLLVR
jgi:hypothetical protein